MGGRKSLILLVAMSVLLAAVLVGCGGSTTDTTAAPTETTAAPAGSTETTAASAPAGVIKIGSSVPLTGALAKEGQLVKEGYEFWRDTVNGQGGIKVGNDMYTVELVLYDDKSDAPTAAKLTEKLITEDKVDFLLSPYSSGLTISTSATAEKYQKVNIAPLANATKIYDRGLKYLFSILWPTSIDVSNLVEMLPANGIDVKKIAFVYPDDLFPAAGAEGAIEAAKQLNIPYVDIKYPKGLKDLSGVVAEIKKANADAVISTAFFEDAALILRQMNEQGVKPPFVAFHDAVNLQPDFIDAVGSQLAEGVSGRSEFWPLEANKDDVFGSGVDFANGIEAKYGHPHTYHQAAAATAGVVLQKAIEAAGSLDNEKVREALLNLDIETFNHPVKFGTMEYKGETLTNVNTKGKPLSVQVQNGELVVTYPDDVKTADLLYPKPW
ncbi:MAG: amino acid ABC transporter substrate-binding protein [Thermoleophilia bacterium]|nr:amino acid ABC transporter substrate-binding protein [Thermoleophilia bacterium]